MEPNPRIETVRKGAELCKAGNIEVVLPIGGGSTIDCAKIIAAGALYDGDAWDLVLDEEDPGSPSYRCGPYPGGHRLGNGHGGRDLRYGLQQ